MKTKNCIIRLTFVSDQILRASNEEIQEGMYLVNDAVECLLNGEMFSSLYCMWAHASLFSEDDAKNAVRQLSLKGMAGAVIKVI